MNISKTLRIVKEHVKSFGLPLAESIGGDPLKILISTILSARTKDEVTAKVCKELFNNDWRNLSIKELRKIIKPINFYKNKSRYIKDLQKLKQVPDTMEELIKLPGVGRKTANIVLNVAFNKPSIAVDTHVHRVCNRWGYVNTKTPKQTEMELREKLPQKHWNEINYLLVLFGQNTCKPISPWCSKCPINDCPRIGVKKNR